MLFKRCLTCSNLYAIIKKLLNYHIEGEFMYSKIRICLWYLSCFFVGVLCKFMYYITSLIINPGGLFSYNSHEYLTIFITTIEVLVIFLIISFVLTKNILTIKRLGIALTCLVIGLILGFFFTIQ